MGISKQSIDDLRNRSKISDFILSSTTGKLRGNKGMALCPFHGEKTASMSFTDEDNLFHCFGCKEGGDIYKYIQLISYHRVLNNYYLHAKNNSNNFKQ